MPDILSRITEMRRADLACLGISFGEYVPSERIKSVLPFLENKGVIMEIKRASPSKGTISANLDAGKQAVLYAENGAAAISVLTERNFFKGSLADLCAAAASFPQVPLLRKDFLLREEEIDVSYRCGADAVLLIARILSGGELLRMTARCASFGIRALVEVREQADIEKFVSVYSAFPQTVCCGINARCLADFSIDPLVPLAVRSEIFKRLPQGAHVPVVFESGIRTPAAAASAACFGFSAVLVGEAVSRNPHSADAFAKSFAQGEVRAVSFAQSRAYRYWTLYAEKCAQLTLAQKRRPFVKICGLCRAEDALFACDLGADSLGFVFSAASPRNTDAAFVRMVRRQLEEKASGSGDGARVPECVGVITETDSPEAREAFLLAQSGVLDVIQFHGCALPAFDDALFADIPRYGAVRVSAQNPMNANALASVSALFEQGELRVLADSCVQGVAGGTGVRIPEDIVAQLGARGKLWLAGGITAENVSEICRRFSPERIDIASGVEKSPGIKDWNKLRALFASLAQSTSEEMYD